MRRRTRHDCRSKNNPMPCRFNYADITERSGATHCWACGANIEEAHR